MMDPRVVAALAAWRKSKEPAGDACVFLHADSSSFEIDKLADLLRRRLWLRQVRRHELHNKGENRGRLRAHDLRGTLVKRSLATGVLRHGFRTARDTR
jgi:hypothetical protein